MIKTSQTLIARCITVCVQKSFTEFYNQLIISHVSSLISKKHAWPLIIFFVWKWPGTHTLYLINTYSCIFILWQQMFPQNMDCLVRYKVGIVLQCPLEVNFIHLLQFLKIYMARIRRHLFHWKLEHTNRKCLIPSIIFQLDQVGFKLFP